MHDAFMIGFMDELEKIASVPSGVKTRGGGSRGALLRIKHKHGKKLARMYAQRSQSGKRWQTVEEQAKAETLHSQGTDLGKKGRGEPMAYKNPFAPMIPNPAPEMRGTFDIWKRV